MRAASQGAEPDASEVCSLEGPSIPLRSSAVRGLQWRAAYRPRGGSIKSASQLEPALGRSQVLSPSSPRPADKTLPGCGTKRNQRKAMPKKRIFGSGNKKKREKGNLARQGLPSLRSRAFPPRGVLWLQIRATAQRASPRGFYPLLAAAGRQYVIGAQRVVEAEHRWGPRMPREPRASRQRHLARDRTTRAIGGTTRNTAG